MPSPGFSSTWGRQDWSQVLIQALQRESAVARAPVRRIIVNGAKAFVPRMLVAPVAGWTAELAELPTDAGNADTIELTPRKIGTVAVLSTESVMDSSVDSLDAVGDSLVRGVAQQVDTKFFSADVATATAPAGLRSFALPATIGPVDIANLIAAIGAVAERGGVADTIFVAPSDLTALRQAVVAGGYEISDPTAPGVERIAGAQLIAAPLPAGVAIACQASFALLGIRKDASLELSMDARFTSDAIAARTTMRLDWAPADVNAFQVVRPV